MRFNRVLLLAASVNLAVLAMLFTISCSGDKGAKGKDADFSQCAITDGKLICGGTEIGDIGGIDIPPGSDPCTLQGQVLTCGDKTYDFSKSGCNVSEFMGRPNEVVQVNCGGDISGLCSGVPFDFDTEYCFVDGSSLPFRALKLPECGSSKTKYSPNKGEACVSGAVVNCAEQEHYWPKWDGSTYSKCDVDTRYEECKGKGDDIVGIFYKGQLVTVRDSLNGRDASERQGTQYCKNSGTDAAVIATCLGDFGDGWIPDENKNYTTCRLKTNYLECPRAAGLIAGAFNATTHICDKAGTATASIQECSVLKGFPEFTPDKDAVPAYSDCKIADGYGECLRNNELIGIYKKMTQICANAGQSTARVETCGVGFIPRDDGRECVNGKTVCAARSGGSTGSKAYWDEEKQNCYYSEQTSCYENNKNASNCLYSLTSGSTTAYGWYKDGDGSTVCAQGSYSAAEEGDAYYDAGKNKCYASAREYCETEVGLWMASSKVNGAIVAGKFDDCKAVNDLDERECVSNNYFWGDLPTAGLTGANKSCRETGSLAAVVCAGNGTQTAAQNSRPAGTVKSTHIYGWDTAARKCKLINSTASGIETFANAAACEATLCITTQLNTSPCFWDAGQSKCFFNDTEAQTACGMALSNDACPRATPAALCTSDFTACLTSANCIAANFVWDAYASPVARCVGGVTACASKALDPTAASPLNTCDAPATSGPAFTGKCKLTSRPLEVAESGFGLVFGECVSENICANAEGFLSGFTANALTSSKATTCIGSCDKKQRLIGSNDYCSDSCADFIGKGMLDIHASMNVSASSTTCYSASECTSTGKVNVAKTVCAATCKDHAEYEVHNASITVGSVTTTVGSCIKTCPSGKFISTDNKYCTDNCASLSIAETNPSSGSNQCTATLSSSSGGGSSSSASAPACTEGAGEYTDGVTASCECPAGKWWAETDGSGTPNTGTDHGECLVTCTEGAGEYTDGVTASCVCETGSWTETDGSGTPNTGTDHGECI